MAKFYSKEIRKSSRIPKLVEHLFAEMPEIESARALLLTESYRATEGQPMVLRRAKAFAHILENIPIIIRPDELIVGSSTLAARGCQTFPEFSYAWLEEELDTVEGRSADPFRIRPEVKEDLRRAHGYWKGKTTSELAYAYMAPEARQAIEHNIFTPGNYYYNGVGHVTVQYEKVLAMGMEGIRLEAGEERAKLCPAQEDYGRRNAFLEAVEISAKAVMDYAARYVALAREMAAVEPEERRREELYGIALCCEQVPAKPAKSFRQACQSFWFVQQLLQMESSGHSISPGRFDQYMYPYYRADMAKGAISREEAQEWIDCLFVKLNDLNKCRDAASAEGFAGYSLFQNLIVGGQDKEGRDVTNDLSFMCITASQHVFLPQPSLSIRVWNGSPQELLIRAAELTRTGIGLPAYYNDEVIIPSLMNRGLSLADAREYNIIGCVEPQKAGKTEGWHDAAFFNLCRPLELVFSQGEDQGVQIGPRTQAVEEMEHFDQFLAAYKTQMHYFIRLLVNSDNAIDLAHAQLAPLPFESSLVEDCIKRGRSLQEGGAVYNFTGPQGFGLANVADSLYAIKRLAFDSREVGLGEWKQAMEWNYGQGLDAQSLSEKAARVLMELMERGIEPQEAQVAEVVEQIRLHAAQGEAQERYAGIWNRIEELPKFGNDEEEPDEFARMAAYIYTKALPHYRNPRGGIFQAGLYPVSANVPLGKQTGATPDGRLAHTPVADGVSPSPAKDAKGPTAATNSVPKLDHGIASNGTLFNQKYHPSALEGERGLENFVAMIRSFFDQKGSHIQFNIVDRQTLLDAQQHPEKYKHLVVRVAGYSALFTTLSKSLQDDIIGRTEQSAML